MFCLFSLLLTIVVSTAIEIIEQAAPNLVETIETIEQQTIIEATPVSVQLTTEIEAQPQPIIITNAIDPAMLAYKHWTGTYSPEIFTISINNTLVAAGETYALTSADTELVVQFDYSFMNGIRKGSKKISYQMNKEVTEAKLTFSWLDTWKVIIDNAVPVKEIT